MRNDDAVVEWLAANPGWHGRKEMLEGAGVPRGSSHGVLTRLWDQDRILYEGGRYAARGTAAETDPAPDTSPAQAPDPPPELPADTVPEPVPAAEADEAPAPAAGECAKTSSSAGSVTANVVFRPSSFDPEVSAIDDCLHALGRLDGAARWRVLRYLCTRAKEEAEG